MLDGFKDIGFVPGQDFNVVTISIDPKETSELARLKREAVINDLKKLKPASDWYFLTGEESNIRKLSDQLGFEYKLNLETGLYSHAPGIFILDSKGNLSASLADVMYPKDVLEYNLVKASNGSLGSWSQKFSAFWREYDFEKNNLKLNISKIGLFIFGFFVSLLVIFKFASLSRGRR